MSPFITSDMYSGSDLRSQLQIAERTVVNLEKANKTLKLEKDWLEFKLEMLEKQLMKDKQLSFSDCILVEEPIDEGQRECLSHGDKILNSKN